jgi:hypothetical protein
MNSLEFIDVSYLEITETSWGALRISASARVIRGL